MKRNVSVWDSLPYPTEFSQNGHLSVVEKSSCYRAQFIVKIRARKTRVAQFHFAPENCQSLHFDYADVTTKFSRVDRFPFTFGNGAPLARS